MGLAVRPVLQKNIWNARVAKNLMNLSIEYMLVIKFQDINLESTGECSIINFFVKIVILKIDANVKNA